MAEATLPNRAAADRDQTFPLVAFGALVAALVYAYWPMLELTSRVWSSSGQYSHGWLVPLFSAALLWFRREEIGEVKAWERWCGAALLGGALLARVLLASWTIITMNMYTFVPALLGAAMLVGGWRCLKWAGPPLAFLIFMFPLPTRAEQALLNPLQAVATDAGTYALQTLGIETYSEGNVITVGPAEVKMNVIEQCSGLRMLTIFLALSVAMTMVATRHWWENIVILASAVPIALLVNVIRITVTGVLYVVWSEEVAQKVFHDLAGWIMMPMALGLLYVELQILSHLVIEEGPVALSKVGFGPQVPVPQSHSPAAR
jgi:exosortase